MNRSIKKNNNLIEKKNSRDRNIELELLEKIKNGDLYALEKFMKINQGLVVSIAKKYAFNPNIMDDLISEGNIGLLEAVKKFKPEKHTRFGTYAYFWVKRYIMRAIANKTFRVPEKIQKMKIKYKNLIEKIKLEKNRYPENSEMASLLKIDLPTFLKYKPYFEATMISPVFKDREDENYELFDIRDFGTDSNRWDRMLIDKEIINKLFERLKNKNKRIKTDIWIKVLKLHFGIDNGIPRSYKEIAKEMGMSRQRIHQIVKNCLKYLNNEIKEMKNEGII